METLGKVVLASVGIMIAGISTAISDTGTPKPDNRQRAPEGQGPAVLWRQPDDIASRDLYYGPGGKAHEPNARTYSFQEEDREGSSPKFVAVDENGVKWRVKLGSETRPETVASRLVWAVGYFANEDYFVPSLKIQNLERLHRGEKYVSPDGTVRGARLKRHLKGEQKLGYWSWGDNPFKDSREWYGLQVLMALLNNWDLKDSNNSVYQVSGAAPEQHYMVSDLGSTFGATRWNSQSNGDLKSYSRSRFISSTSKSHVDFTVPALPGFPHVFNIPYSTVHVR